MGMGGGVGTEGMAQWTRPCGECTLCCQLIRIDRSDEGDAAFPFDKPAGVNCKHCRTGRGCEVFGTESFPKLCQTYLCLWKDPSFLPESYRPDKVNAICHVVGEIHGRLVFRVIVDRHKPVTASFSRWVDRCVATGIAFVVQTGDGMAVISDSPSVSKLIESSPLAKGSG